MLFALAAVAAFLLGNPGLVSSRVSSVDGRPGYERSTAVVLELFDARAIEAIAGVSVGGDVVAKLDVELPDSAPADMPSIRFAAAPRPLTVGDTVAVGVFVSSPHQVFIPATDDPPVGVEEPGPGDLLVLWLLAPACVLCGGLLLLAVHRQTPIHRVRLFEEWRRQRIRRLVVSAGVCVATVAPMALLWDSGTSEQVELMRRAEPVPAVVTDVFAWSGDHYDRLTIVADSPVRLEPYEVSGNVRVGDVATGWVTTTGEVTASTIGPNVHAPIAAAVVVYASMAACVLSAIAGLWSWAALCIARAPRRFGAIDAAPAEGPMSPDTVRTARTPALWPAWVDPDVHGPVLRGRVIRAALLVVATGVWIVTVTTLDASPYVADVPADAMPVTGTVERYEPGSKYSSSKAEISWVDEDGTKERFEVRDITVDEGEQVMLLRVGDDVILSNRFLRDQTSDLAGWSMVLVVPVVLAAMWRWFDHTERIARTMPFVRRRIDWVSQRAFPPRAPAARVRGARSHRAAVPRGLARVHGSHDVPHVSLIGESGQRTVEIAGPGDGPFLLRLPGVPAVFRCSRPVIPFNAWRADRRVDRVAARPARRHQLDEVGDPTLNLITSIAPDPFVAGGMPPFDEPVPPAVRLAVVKRWFESVVVSALAAGSWWLTAGAARVRDDYEATLGVLAAERSTFTFTSSDRLATWVEVLVAISIVTTAIAVTKLVGAVRTGLAARGRWIVVDGFAERGVAGPLKRAVVRRDGGVLVATRRGPSTVDVAPEDTTIVVRQRGRALLVVDHRGRGVERFAIRSGRRGERLAADHALFPIVDTTAVSGIGTDRHVGSGWWRVPRSLAITGAIVAIIVAMTTGIAASRAATGAQHWLAGVRANADASPDHTVEAALGIPDSHGYLIAATTPEGDRIWLADGVRPAEGAAISVVDDPRTLEPVPLSGWFEHRVPIAGFGWGIASLAAAAGALITLRHAVTTKRYTTVA